MTAARPELRDRLRSARRSMPIAERAAAEATINRLLVGLPELQATRAGGRRVALSLPTDGEVDVTPTGNQLVERGWELHLPVVGDERSMHFVPWRPGDPLVANRYGIDEPADGPRRSAHDLDVVVVPCVGVDPDGNRLGFGAGFYDRALAGQPMCLTVAAVFEDQVIDRLTPQLHDVAVQVIVTERGVRPTAQAVRGCS